MSARIFDLILLAASIALLGATALGVARMPSIQRIAWHETMDPDTEEIADPFWRWVRRL